MMSLNALLLAQGGSALATGAAAAVISGGGAPEQAAVGAPEPQGVKSGSSAAGTVDADAAAGIASEVPPAASSIPTGTPAEAAAGQSKHLGQQQKAQGAAFPDGAAGMKQGGGEASAGSRPDVSSVIQVEAAPLQASGPGAMQQQHSTSRGSGGAGIIANDDDGSDAESEPEGGSEGGSEDKDGAEGDSLHPRRHTWTGASPDQQQQQQEREGEEQEGSGSSSKPSPDQVQGLHPQKSWQNRLPKASLFPAEDDQQTPGLAHIASSRRGTKDSAMHSQQRQQTEEQGGRGAEPASGSEEEEEDGEDGDRSEAFSIYQGVGVTPGGPVSPGIYEGLVMGTPEHSPFPQGTPGMESPPPNWPPSASTTSLYDRYTVFASGATTAAAAVGAASSAPANEATTDQAASPVQPMWMRGQRATAPSSENPTHPMPATRPAAAAPPPPPQPPATGPEPRHQVPKAYQQRAASAAGAHGAPAPTPAAAAVRPVAQDAGAMPGFLSSNNPVFLRTRAGAVASEVSRSL